MEIKHILEDTKGYFQIKDGETVAAYISYSRAGEELIILDHTDVNPVYKGKSLGRQLVNHVVSYAREKQIKVMSVCPFATSVFLKDESLRDVLR